MKGRLRVFGVMYSMLWLWVESATNPAMGVQEVYGEDHSKYIDALEQVQSVEKQVHASLQHPSLAY